MAKIPKIKPGDLVKVYTKIKEGDKERLSPYQGVVIQIRGNAGNKMFTVRKISAGVGIERIFPINSPLIAKIEVKKKGKVRRAKLTYLRERKGKKMKIREVTAPVKKAQPEVSTPEKETSGKTESAIAEEAMTTAQPEDKTGESAAGPKSVENA